MELEKLRFKKAKGTTTKAHLVRHLSFDLVRHLGETKILGFPDFSQLLSITAGLSEIAKAG